MDEAAGGGAAEEDDQDQEGHREDEGDIGRRAREGGKGNIGCWSVISHVKSVSKVLAQLCDSRTS